MKLFTLKAIATLLISLLLNGCGTTYISGNISTSIDPSFVPRTNLRVVVVPKDLDAVYYLPVLREALENRGFTNISISRSNKVSPDYFDVKVFLGVGRNISEETKTVNDYGVVGQNIDPGDVKCKTSNNALTGARMRCRTGKTEVENIYGVTGTREVTTTSLSRSISLSFTSLSNNQSVISAIGTSDVSDYRCSNAGIYKFLIIHTLKRLDFGTPRNFDYIVELPEGYDCESSLEYERSLRIQSGGSQVRSTNSQSNVSKKSARTYSEIVADRKKAARTYSEIVADRKKAASKEAEKNTGNITKPNRSSSIVGCIYGNCENGQGTYNYAKGGQYVGYWKGGKRNGQGTYTWADGRKKEGQWIDGKFDKASLGDGLEDTIERENAEGAMKAMVYEIPELGISVRDYIGSHVVAHISEGMWSKGIQSSEGVIVVGVEAGGRASNLTIEKGHRIVSAWVKGSKTAVPIKDSQALKLIAEGKEPKYFKNFHVVKTENGFAEWAKLKLLSVP